MSTLTGLISGGGGGGGSSYYTAYAGNGGVGAVIIQVLGTA